MEFGAIMFLLILLIAALAQKASGSTVTLDAAPTALKKSGDTVALTWKGLDSPSKLDWIGIYSPPTSDDDHFIGYILLSSCPNWATGACSLQIPLINMRAPYDFRLFRGVYVNLTASAAEGNLIAMLQLDSEGNPLPNTTSRLASSPHVAFANYNEPTQVHLSLTEKSDEMRVMFVTRDPIRSIVKYGDDDDELGMTVEASSWTYRISDMCDAPANTSVGWREPGYIHSALLARLKPGGRYYYQVGSNEGGWSSLFSFIALIPNADETNAILFGDMGVSVPYTTLQYVQDESRNTIKWLKRDLQEIGEKPTFISHIGDISYARGYSWLWDAFFAQIEPVAATSPYHVCMGNHEYDWPLQPFKPDWSPYGRDGGGECGVPYSLRFTMPGNSSLATGNSSPDTKNLYYSLDVGVVHFLYYATEIDFFPESDQYNFIVHDLKTVDRKKTPFVIFLGHRPMYSTDRAALLEPISSYLVQTFEPLLIENKVTLAFCGHVHKYERMCPLQNFTCVEPSGNGELPIHVVIGMAGAPTQPTDAALQGHRIHPIFPQPEWSLFRSFEWGYMRLHATRHLLTLSYVGNHDGRVHDVLEIPCPDDLRDGLYVDLLQDIPQWEDSTSRKSRVGVHPEQSGRPSRNSAVEGFKFVCAFLVGFGIGVSVVIFLFHRRRLKWTWQPVGRDDTVDI